MINAGDVYENDKYNQDLIKKSIINQNKSKIILVLVATHFHELKKISPLISDLKKFGYEVALI